MVLILQKHKENRPCGLFSLYIKQNLLYATLEDELDDELVDELEDEPDVTKVLS